MGERVALGLLEEQMLSYNELGDYPVSLSFTSFDGDEITLQTTGGSTPESVRVTVMNKKGFMETRDQWWNRDIMHYSMPRASDDVVGIV